MRESDREFDAGDILQGSEKLWGAAAHASIALAQPRGLPHHSHGDMKRAVAAVGNEQGDETLRKGFADAESFHANFYHAFMSEDELAELRPLVQNFVNRLLELAS